MPRARTSKEGQPLPILDAHLSSTQNIFQKRENTRASPVHQSSWRPPASGRARSTISDTVRWPSPRSEAAPGLTWSSLGPSAATRAASGAVLSVAATVSDPPPRGPPIQWAAQRVGGRTIARPAAQSLPRPPHSASARPAAEPGSRLRQPIRHDRGTDMLK